ncbi:MAG: cupin domain-containing protein [Cellvibrionaceae bacterium]|nr:cupin domain-containing protein [Cellvibrionaceae bacterium]
MLRLPVDHATFMAHHFEQRPLLCRGAVDKDEVEWRDLDDLLQTLDPNPAVLQLFFSQELVAPQTYLRDIFHLGRKRLQLDKHRFYELMRRGATLVLNHSEDYFSAACDLCADVARFTHQPTSGNAYISFKGEGAFAGAGAFGKHWDTHDVFAVQWIGKKRWRIYEPTLPLPMPHQTSRHVQNTCPAQPSFEYVLEHGDILYIPRGWWHEVDSLECASWHISVATYPQNIADYLLWVCGHALPHMLDARRTFVENATPPDFLREVMQALTQAACSEELQNEFSQPARRQEIPHTQFHSELFLVDPDAPIPLGASICLNHLYAFGATNEALKNGRPQLNSAGRELMQLVQHRGEITWQGLQEIFKEIPAAALRKTLLDLIHQDLLSLKLPRS